MKHHILEHLLLTMCYVHEKYRGTLGEGKTFDNLLQAIEDDLSDFTKNGPKDHPQKDLNEELLDWVSDYLNDMQAADLYLQHYQSNKDVEEELDNLGYPSPSKVPFDKDGVPYLQWHTDDFNCHSYYEANKLNRVVEEKPITYDLILAIAQKIKYNVTYEDLRRMVADRLGQRVAELSPDNITDMILMGTIPRVETAQDIVEWFKESYKAQITLDPEEDELTQDDITIPFEDWAKDEITEWFENY